MNISNVLDVEVPHQSGSAECSSLKRKTNTLEYMKTNMKLVILKLKGK